MEVEFFVGSVDDQRNTNSHQGAHSGQTRRGSNVPTSSPASTRCMIISDLQWKIFQLVDDTDLSRNKTLLALALTCKPFTGPALDLLWQGLCGLAPLIRCLPQSLWKPVEGKLEIQRAMTFDDWCIFCKYNHRVHSLNTSVDGVIPVGTGIWRTLSCPPFSLPLLPNLTSLIWSEAASETFPCIRLFITPKLTKLDISKDIIFGLSEQSILSSIPMLCPSVSNFSVDLNIESGDMSTTLQYWSHLSSVSTGELSEAAILHLSNLPSLQYLKFRLPLLPISADTRKLLQRPAFHALRQLDIECDTLELLDTFLETLSIALRVLSITITCQVNTTRALPASISCLSKACAHTSLQQVQINIEDWSFDGDGDAIGAAAFQPLYAMRNLRKLDLDVAVFAHLDDAGLLQMAKAWPLLEEFYFNKTILSLHNVTPNAFVSLLQHCPCLVSVGIAVDWSTIDKHDISPNVPYQGFTHDALSQVFFGASKISHPTRIAAFISAIAPNLESIEAWSPDFHGHDQDFHKYSGRWNLVRYLIKSFSMVREQGRRMILNAGEGTDENVRGPCGCYGVVQPAQETENRETAVGGDIGWGGEGPKEGNGSESDYMPHSEHVSSEEEDEE